MPKFELDVWVTREFPRTWTHVIKGSFADPQFDTQAVTDLLCYDRNAGFGAFFATVRNGRLDDGTLVQDGPHQVGANLTFSRRWTHIVNGPFPGGVQILFYDAASGVGEFYATDGRGNLILKKQHSGWRTSWTQILAGRFGNANLLFYDAANGTGEFYSVDNSGDIHLIRQNNGWRNSWHSIITGDFSSSQYDDLLFYDKGAGSGEFYKTDGNGRMMLLSEHDNWRNTWQQVLSGQFLPNSTYDGLLFYEESSGYTELYSTEGHGNISRIDVNLGSHWALPWQVILAGEFTPNIGLIGTSRLCSYDARDGVISYFYFDPILSPEGRWTALNHQPPFNASTMLLLTDGTVICQDVAQDHAKAQWYKFTPDLSGSYINGTWSTIHAMNHARKFFASQVLTDGSVLVVGGEYFDDSKTANNTSTAELYDPVADQWTTVTTSFSWIRGDAPSCMLADGRILYGSLSTNQSAIFNPIVKTWVEAGTAFGAGSASKHAANSDEETWVLLPDGTVLTVECANIGKAEKYVPFLDKWVNAVETDSVLPVTLVDSAQSEIGPAILLTDGRVFFVGATGHTAFYTPPATDPSLAGTWTAGPDIRDNSNNLMSVIDGPACLLPNGKVLLVAGKRHLESGSFWSGPSRFFQFDPVSNTITELDNQPATATGDTWKTRLLLLPTGQVMFTNTTNQVYLYNPDGSWDQAWQPTILNWNQSLLVAGQTYTVEGTQLNGLSQAVSYGDDYTAATNYPLARLPFDNTGHLYYCRTSGFSTMGVATGPVKHRFQFEVPSSLTETGPAVLVISVNGIPADMIQLSVSPKLATVPEVFGESSVAAANLVHAAGLVPKFTGVNNTHSWVFSQSPAAGTVVAQGSIVTMVLHTGPRP